MPDGDVLALIKELKSAKISSPDEAQLAQLQTAINDKSAPFHARLLAAQALAGQSIVAPIDNVPSIVASLKGASPEAVVRLFVAWCDRAERAGFPTRDDGYELFYHLLKELAKLKTVVFAPEHRDSALYATLFYAEVSPGKDSAKCLPLFLKTFLREPIDREEVFELLLTEISPGLKAKYDLLSAIILLDSSVLNAENLSALLSELATVARSQEGSSTCVLLLATVLQTVESDGMIDWLADVVTTTEKSARNNVHRSWLCRLAALPALHPIIDRLLAKCRERFETAIDPIDFPPGPREIHEWTCIDPYERWEEDEEVYWPSDALLSTVLLLVSLRQKGPIDDSLRHLLIAASKWHLEEIRLTALQLLKRLTMLSNEETTDLLLRNLYADEDSLVRELTTGITVEAEDAEGRLERVMQRAASSGHKVALHWLLQLRPESGRAVARDLLVSIDAEDRRMAYSVLESGLLYNEEKAALREALGSATTVDERSIDFLNWLAKSGAEQEVTALIIDWQKEDKPGWIRAAHLLPADQLGQIIDRSGARIEALLALSGSASVHECPSFTEFYEKIRAAGLQPKQYSDEMLTRLSLLEHAARSSCSSEGDAILPAASAARTVFETILRCRYKAVVDQGASIFEAILKGSPDLAEGYCSEILSLLSSPSSACRSLSLSRTLLSCSLVRPSLVATIETAFRATHALPTEKRPSLIRWLKTLKLMTAKANDTKLSPSFIEWLFFVCVHLQYRSADFLERSAAMCLYSFCILKMVGPTSGSPLFALLAARPAFAARLFDLVQQLPSLPRIVTVLVSSFLAKLDYVADGFYGEEWAGRLDAARSTFWRLLLQTGRKRERRFIVDAFLALTPRAEREALREQFEYDRDEDALQYLKETLIERELPSGAVVVERLERSAYWRAASAALETRSCAPLESLKRSHEPAALVAGLALGALGRRMREEEEDEELEGGEEWTSAERLWEALRTHGRPRVRAAAARAEDEWREERRREERGATRELSSLS